jgi:four helix bundle protein
MTMQVQELALATIEALAPLMPLIEQRDRGLALQLRGAASSMALNIAEAEGSDPGNKRARFFTASGSTRESRTALRVAVAWGFVSRERAAPIVDRLDHVAAILWKLTHGR